MMQKLYNTILIISLLTSCGFQVIYRENIVNNTSYEEELSSIRIQKDNGRLTQEMRNALKDLFNPNYLESEPKYILVLTLAKSVSGTFITFTGASGRNKVNLTINYALKDIKSGETLVSGATTVNDNYDVQDNRYGTYVAENYAFSNLVKVAALNIRNLLVNDFIEIKKNIENEKQLAAILVQTDDSEEISRLVSKSFEEIFNKKYNKCAPYYTLSLKVAETISPAEKFSENKISIDIKYELRKAKNNELIEKDFVTLDGQYITDSTDNKAIEDAFRVSLARKIAKNIQLSLVDIVDDFYKNNSEDEELIAAIKSCQIDVAKIEAQKKPVKVRE